MANEALKAYEAILADPKADPQDVAHVFSALHQLKCGGPRFLAPALLKFADPNPRVRTSALVLVGQVGAVADAPKVVPLLKDGEPMVLIAAANALVAIGGRRELAALNARLQGGNWIDARLELRQHVEKCRDRLKKRLDDLVKLEE